jgi:RNA-binding protein
LEEIGEIIHLAKSGRLIVKLSKDGKETNSGDILLDANGKRIGKVIEIIGSINAPYATVVPMTDRTYKIIGIKVFRGGQNGSKNKGRTKSKQISQTWNRR